MAAANTQSYGVANFATGSLTGAAAIEEVILGFRPRHVKVFNATDVIVWEKFADMVTADSIKTVTAGTTTKDTTGAITLNERSFSLSAAAAASGKALSWVAFG